MALSFSEQHRLQLVAEIPQRFAQRRIDDRRHRFAFHPGKTDRLLYIGWEAKGKLKLQAAEVRFREYKVEVRVGDAARYERRGAGVDTRTSSRGHRAEQGSSVHQADAEIKAASGVSSWCSIP
jgi:hypothetical protein